MIVSLGSSLRRLTANALQLRQPFSSMIYPKSCDRVPKGLYATARRFYLSPSASEGGINTAAETSNVQSSGIGDENEFRKERVFDDEFAEESNSIREATSWTSPSRNDNMSNTTSNGMYASSNEEHA